MKDENNTNNAFAMHDDGNHDINENVVIPPQEEDTYSKTEMLDVTAIMRSVNTDNATPETSNTNSEKPTIDPLTGVVEVPIPEEVVYDELTGVALHEDTNGLEGTTAEEVVEEEVVKKPKSPLFYFLLFLFIFLLVVGVVFAILFAKSSFQKIENKKGTVYYFYSSGIVTYSESTPEGYDLLHSYECKGRKCLVDVFSSDKNYPYAVIYDDGYYVFDYSRGSLVDLKLKDYGFDVRNGKTSLLAIDDKERLKGFIITSYQNNDVMSCYYSISKKKIVYQTTKWLPYTDSNIMYFINNSYIALYQKFDDVVKSKLIDFKSGIELGEIVGYYSAYYDSIRKNWYIVAKESSEPNAKIKLLKDDRLSYVLPSVQDYQHVGFNTSDKNTVYLTNDTDAYYVCDANAGICETHKSTYVVFDVIDDIYKIVKYNNQYAIMKTNSSPVTFRPYSSSDELLFDYDMTTFYKQQDTVTGEVGVHIYFKDKETDKDCLEYLYDETTNTVTELSNTCKKK